jgi:AraC-like DNA-binding protein
MQSSSAATTLLSRTGGGRITPPLFDDGQCRRQAIAVLPRSFIEARAPWLRRRPVFKLASNSVYVDLTRRHLLQLTADDLTEGELALLTENLCNLLALLDHADTPINRVQPEVQLEALLDFCRRNLHDPALSPDFVAAQFGISTRTLHLRFEKLEQTFGRWLLDARLDASSNALRNPQQYTCSISEIAYSCGFNDLSHFNKSFRTRFGVSPSEAAGGCCDWRCCRPRRGGSCASTSARCAECGGAASGAQTLGVGASAVQCRPIDLAAVATRGDLLAAVGRRLRSRFGVGFACRVVIGIDHGQAESLQLRCQF